MNHDLRERFKTIAISGINFVIAPDNAWVGDIWDFFFIFKVAPAELEQLLLEHPKIVDVAVIGIPDLATGELPKAFVVRSDEALTETDVQNFVKG